MRGIAAHAITAGRVLGIALLVGVVLAIAAAPVLVLARIMLG